MKLRQEIDRPYTIANILHINKAGYTYFN